MAIVKWGFGAAPFKPQTEYAYKKALRQVSLFVLGEELANGVDITEEISAVKGMLNRILRQDQWDWFTVFMYLDYPPLEELSALVFLLSNLRKAITDSRNADIEMFREKIQKTNYCVYAENFLRYKEHEDFDGGYIYILSRREEKDLLKIGMTTRNIIKRCQEINSATGVVYPLSPRAAFRVTDASLAEKMVHKTLDSFRVRADREFFVLPYKKAYDLITKCLVDNGLLYYKS